MKLELANGMILSDWEKSGDYAYIRLDLNDSFAKIAVFNSSMYYFSTWNMGDFNIFIRDSYGIEHHGSIEEKMAFMDKMLVKFYKLQVFS